jgi:hypothetical protein
VHFLIGDKDKKAKTDSLAALKNTESTGELKWKDGGKYVGQFKGGKIHGKGTHTWANGDIYYGEWKDN